LKEETICVFPNNFVNLMTDITPLREDVFEIEIDEIIGGFRAPIFAVKKQ